MHRVEGNLTTGTHISICNWNGNDTIATAEARGDGYQPLGTKDRNDENPKVRTITTPGGVLYSYFLVPVVFRESGEQPL
jgi:hypothetical protein